MPDHSRKEKSIFSRVYAGVFLLSLSALVVYPLQAYSQGFEFSATLERRSEIKAGDKIAINFSFPVITSSIEEGFSMVPMQKVSFKWENSNKRVVISPQEYWSPQTEYIIKISNGRDIIFRKLDKKFDFETEKFPKIDSFTPATGEKNVAIDIEDPVRINFDSSLDGFNVKFVVNPIEDLSWQLNENKTEVSLLSKNNFKAGTRYSIGVFMKNKVQPADDYVKIGETFFDTAQPPLPENWDKDPAVRVEQAKKFTPALITEGKYIDVNLSKQMMVIFENSTALDAYVISSGKIGMETPQGSFSIQNKAPRVWSKAYSLFMPYWMAIIPSGKIGIHELPEWPGGYKEGASHLGSAVSHGCVRLGEGSAKRVYDWAEIGTPVIVH